MRNQIAQLLIRCGGVLAGTVHDRLKGLEIRLDDVRCHSNQVESKVDYLISLFEGQRRQLETEVQDLNSQVRDLNSLVQDLKSRIEDLKCRTQQLAENDGVMLQGAIHIVESIRGIKDLTH